MWKQRSSLKKYVPNFDFMECTWQLYETLFNSSKCSNNQSSAMLTNLRKIKLSLKLLFVCNTSRGNFHYFSRLLFGVPFTNSTHTRCKITYIIVSYNGHKVKAHLHMIRSILHFIQKQRKCCFFFKYWLMLIKKKYNKTQK